MPCDLCGHANSKHKALTMSMHYCSDCGKVETFASFTDDKPGEPLSPIDALKKIF